MRQPIKFELGAGVFAAAPLQCPARRPHCCFGYRDPSGRWIVTKRFCGWFDGLGPNVDHPGVEGWPEDVHCSRPEEPRMPWWRRVLDVLRISVTSEKGLDEQMSPTPPRVGSFEQQKAPGATVVTVGGEVKL